MTLQPKHSGETPSYNHPHLQFAYPRGVWIGPILHGSANRAIISQLCSYLKPAVGVVVGRTLAFVLAIASAVAGSAAIGSIVLRALSDDYLARDGVGVNFLPHRS